MLPGVDAVSHQAARVGLGVRFADVTDYVADNDTGTAVLLAALDAVGFAGRLVLASSMVVYGEGAYRCPACGPVAARPRTAERLGAGRFEPDCPRCGADLVPEVGRRRRAVDPRNTYAATKLHQEHLCTVFGRERDVPVIWLRYHNVYGPRCPVDTPYAGVASLFVAALRRGEAPRVFEDGGQRRASSTSATWRGPTWPPWRPTARCPAPSTSPRAGPARPGTGHCPGRGMGRPDLVPVVTGEWRLGDVRHVTASADRAEAMLGFAAEVPFAAGMAELAAAPA